MRQCAWARSRGVTWRGCGRPGVEFDGARRAPAGGCGARHRRGVRARVPQPRDCGAGGRWRVRGLEAPLGRAFAVFAAARSRLRRPGRSSADFHIVRQVDVVAWLAVAARRVRQHHGVVFVLMDVEGAEHAILRRMEAAGVHRLLSALAVVHGPGAQCDYAPHPGLGRAHLDGSGLRRHGPGVRRRNDAPGEVFKRACICSFRTPASPAKLARRGILLPPSPTPRARWCAPAWPPKYQGGEIDEAATPSFARARTRSWPATSTTTTVRVAAAKQLGAARATRRRAQNRFRRRRAACPGQPRPATRPRGVRARTAGSMPSTPTAACGLERTYSAPAGWPSGWRCTRARRSREVTAWRVCRPTITCSATARARLARRGGVDPTGSSPSIASPTGRTAASTCAAASAALLDHVEAQYRGKPGAVTALRAARARLSEEVPPKRGALASLARVR